MNNLDKKFVIFVALLGIAIGPLGAHAAIDPPIGGNTNHAFAAFDQSGFDNHMYHSGMDFAVGLGTEVKAGVAGEVRAIFGLSAGGGDNNCPDGQERIFLWDSNVSESCPVNLKDGTTRITNCSTQCTGRTGINNYALGISVIVAHKDNAGLDTGHYSLYAHLSQVRGDIWKAYKCLIIDRSIDNSKDCGVLTLKVDKDDIIGRTGASGGNVLDRWGFHLHYEVRRFDSLIAPGPYYSYTPDLPLGYGYEDPRSYFIDPPESSLLVGGKALKVGDNSLRIRSGPGKRYSVLGWTGSNQLLVADRKAISTTGMNGGDYDVVAGRNWYRIRLPSRLGKEPVFGWIPATDDVSSGNVALVTEQPATPIFAVVNASSDKGWPLILDYTATSGDHSKDCIDRVETILNNNCVRVWDNTQNSHYLAVKLWNGTPLAVVPKAGANDEDQYKPVIGPGNRQWYQVYIPALYFSNPAITGCPADLPDDQCKGDLLKAWLPSDALRNTSGGRVMDFEDGKDRVTIQSTIPGLVFSTTDGYDWIYGDWRAGYNGPYPTGSYFSKGNFFAWLGENQGLGRIDFVGNTAVELSLGYSSYATVTLEGCRVSGASSSQLCSDGKGYRVALAGGPGNLNTGRLDRLAVKATNMDYVLFHDTGNFWLIDDLAVGDMLADTQRLVPQDYDLIQSNMLTANKGNTTILEFLIDRLQNFKKRVKVYLDWSGSKFRLAIYDGSGRLVAIDQSQSPPIVLTIPDGEPGTWRAEITAVDIPYNGYPVSLVVASSNVTDSNQVPTANAGPDQTVECISVFGTNVLLDGSASSDPDGDTLSFAWAGSFGIASGVRPIVTLPLGTNPVVLTVDDGRGETSADEVVVSVVDTTPPTITSVTASPNVLWPPNHQMVPVSVVATASDICSAVTSCRVVGVSSNEPVNGLGDGDTSPDWQITGNLSVNLRSERSGKRSGKGSGRLYTITTECTDASGNKSTKNATVSVPHDKRN